MRAVIVIAFDVPDDIDTGELTEDIERIKRQVTFVDLEPTWLGAVGESADAVMRVFAP